MSLNERDIESLPPKPGWFTTTHWSVVITAGRGESPAAEAALETLCRAYWYPLYAFVRRQGHSPPDAEDLVQGFFARLLEKKWLAAAVPEKGKFRSFLLADLNHYLGDVRDRANAAKRGGGKTLLSLNGENGENLLLQEPASNLSPDRQFEKRWAVALLQQALARIRHDYQAAGKGPVFEGLKPFLEGEARPGDYAQVAARLGMSAGTVAVSVHRLRQSYREAVRTEIANTVASPGEIDEELRHLFTVVVQ
jgi:RNA polymerase sigma-70 factor (ECF subfamily)